MKELDFESSASANSATPARYFWKAVTGFEPVMKVLQTSALPLGYTAIFHFCYKKTGVAGFEPTHDGVKVRCLTAWLYPKKKMEESGFEPLNPKERIYSPSRLATSLFLHKWRETESNCRHTELQSVALPTELPRLKQKLVQIIFK